MEKLTTEHIQFIDDRLYNLGVKYIDIRYEMVDHIASELEAMDGDFGDNWHEYFITHRLQLLEQNKKAKRAAILRAIKLYFETLTTPLLFVLAIMLFCVVFFASAYIEDTRDIQFYGICVLGIMIFPLLWFGRKNKDISVMAPMMLIHTAIYSMYQLAIIASYSIDDRAERVIPQRISISVAPALMLILIVSLYRCRKQYVGKYI